MSNFLEPATFGKDCSYIKEAIDVLLPSLRETIDLLNKQDKDNYFSNNLAKRTDRASAKMALEVKAGIEKRIELLGYLERMV